MLLLLRLLLLIPRLVRHHCRSIYAKFNCVRPLRFFFVFGQEKRKSKTGSHRDIASKNDQRYTVFHIHELLFRAKTFECCRLLTVKKQKKKKKMADEDQQMAEGPVEHESLAGADGEAPVMEGTETAKPTRTRTSRKTKGGTAASAKGTTNKRRASQTEFAEGGRSQPVADSKRSRQPEFKFFYVCYLPSEAAQLPSAIVVARDPEEVLHIVSKQYSTIADPNSMPEISRRIESAHCQQILLNAECGIDCTVAKGFNEGPPDEREHQLFIATDFCKSTFGAVVGLVMAPGPKDATEQLSALVRGSVGDYFDTRELHPKIEGPLELNPGACTWLVPPVM